MSQKFQRRIENFTCARCGAAVTGNGYTNHCPVCLYSRHVDIQPGDRGNPCGGLMEPIGAEQTSDGFIIIHQCKTCHETRRCKSVPGDDTAAIVQIAATAARTRI